MREALKCLRHSTCTASTAPSTHALTHFEQRDSVAGHGFTAAHAVHALVGLAFHADGAGIDAERRGEIRPHRIEIRKQLRLLRNHRHIHVRHAVTGLVHLRDRAFQQRDAVGALPFGSVSGNSRPMSPMPAAPSTASVTA